MYLKSLSEMSKISGPVGVENSLSNSEFDVMEVWGQFSLILRNHGICSWHGKMVKLPAKNISIP